MSKQPPLSRGALLQAAVFCATLVVLPAVAIGTPEAPTETPTPTRSLVSVTDDEAVHLSPLLQEIRALLISAIKEQTEIDLLKTQARYAEAEGRIEQAREIRAAVEILEARVERRREEIASRP